MINQLLLKRYPSQRMSNFRLRIIHKNKVYKVRVRIMKPCKLTTVIKISLTRVFRQKICNQICQMNLINAVKNIYLHFLYCFWQEVCQLIREAISFYIATWNRKLNCYVSVRNSIGLIKVLRYYSFSNTLSKFPCISFSFLNLPITLLIN